LLTNPKSHKNPPILPSTTSRDGQGGNIDTDPEDPRWCLRRDRISRKIIFVRALHWRLGNAFPGVGETKGVYQLIYYVMMVCMGMGSLFTFVLLTTRIMICWFIRFKSHTLLPRSIKISAFSQLNTFTSPINRPVFNMVFVLPPSNFLPRSTPHPV
jgi:hypothetical protein